VTAGGGIDGALRLGDVRISAGWAVYDLTYEDRPAVEDWRQVRGHLGISYRFGTEPVREDRRSGAMR
jgi:hypothetical protein